MDSQDKWEGDRNEAYRAIGRYVVTFSELVREMREMTSERVARGVADMDVSALLLGEAPAEGISTAFFGVCRAVGELDDEEERIWNILRSEVREAIETRNDIAHGDWWIGNLALSESGPKVMPPRLIRIRPVRSEGPRKVLDLTVKDIDALSDRLEALLGLIEDFGRLALELPVMITGVVATPTHVSKGEYRVRDVLAVEGGARRKPSKPRPSRRSKAKIVRTGPRAEEVSCGVYSSLAKRAHSSRA